MPLTPSYFLELAAIHLAMFLCLQNVWHAKQRHSWSVAGHVLFAVLTGYGLYRIYELLPALWWPGAHEQYVIWRTGLAGPVIASIALRALAHRQRPAN